MIFALSAMAFKLLTPFKLLQTETSFYENTPLLGQIPGFNGLIFGKSAFNSVRFPLHILSLKKLWCNALHALLCLDFLWISSNVSLSDLFDKLEKWIYNICFVFWSVSRSVSLMKSTTKLSFLFCQRFVMDYSRDFRN